MAFQGTAHRGTGWFIALIGGVVLLTFAGLAGLGEAKGLLLVVAALLVGLVTLVQPRYGLYLYLVLAFFAPEYPGRSFLPEIREDEFLLFLVLFVGFAKISIQDRRFSVIQSPINLPYLLWITVAVLGVLLASVLRGWDVHAQDIYHPVKDTLKFSSFLLVGYLCTRWADVRHVIRLFFWVALVVVGLGILEWLDVGGIRALLRSLYPQHKDFVYLAGLSRVSSTFKNPNFYALYCTMLIGTGLTLWLRRERVLSSPLMTLVLAGSLVTGFATLSRSGVVALALVVLIVLLRERRYSLLLAFTFAMVFLGVYLVGQLGSLSGRWGVDVVWGSAELRWQIFTDALAAALQYPILGWAIRGHVPFTEDLYTSVLVTRGIIGFAAFLYLLWSIHRVLSVVESRSPDRGVRALVSGLHSVYFVYLLVASFTPFFYGERISDAFWILLGAGYATLLPRHLARSAWQVRGRTT